MGQHIWELGIFKDIAASKDAFKILQDNEYIRYDDLPLETIDGSPSPWSLSAMFTWWTTGR